MIKIGFQGREMFPLNPVIMDVRGHLDFSGRFYIGCGSTIRVEPQAKLSIGNGSRMGANGLIFCEDTISIGENVEMSWNCQLMDTDRHEIEDITTHQVYPSHVPIHIGDNVWIGNHVCINKGCAIPDDTIVTSNSLCNKNYSFLPPFL